MPRCDGVIDYQNPIHDRSGWIGKGDRERWIWVYRCPACGQEARIVGGGHPGHPAWAAPGVFICGKKKQQTPT